jgi:hypothetical protein
MAADQVILWAMGGGFAGTWMMMFYMLRRFDQKFDRMQETITDMDRRLCRLEGAFYRQECCVIKDSKSISKAE